MSKLIWFFSISLMMLNTPIMSQTRLIETERNLDYDPKMILDDWKEWEQAPTESNKYVADFMTDYEVPQTGLYGFNLHDTWLLWIQTNDKAIEQYLKMKEENSR